MKRNFLLLTICLLITETISAQYTSGNLFMFGGTVSGPVKKVSITVKQHDDPSDTLTSVAFFDTNRNIVQTGYYRGKKFIIDGIYRYSDNNSCLHYQYNENGVEDTHYYKIYFNANGQELLKFGYWKDKLIRVDSMVYDTQSHLIAKYVSNYMERTPLLQTVYTYDSLGRIIKEQNIKTGEYYTVSYLTNGNYKKTINENGRTYTENYIVNKAGQLIECKSAGKKEKYSHYDKYGNWLKREVVLNTYTSTGLVGTTTERVIEYW